MNQNKISTLRAVLAAAAIAFTATVAYAQASVGQASRAEIPLAFEFQTHQLPAGTYTISKASDRTLCIRGTSIVTLGLLPAGVDRVEAGDSRLVFHRYGDKYFLRDVISLSGARVSFAESRHEKDIRHSEQVARVEGHSPLQHTYGEVTISGTR